MNAPEFIAKWRRVQLSERSASQQHFLDLCEPAGHEKPAAADPEGTHFTFERGARTMRAAGGRHEAGRRAADRSCGWWDGGCVMRQQSRARCSRNPPLLVVCDMDRIVVHTNFTNTPKRVHTVHLDGLGAPRSLEILRAVFFDPDALKPGVTSQVITEAVARRVGEIARALRGRGVEPHAAAHFRAEG